MQRNTILITGGTGILGSAFIRHFVTRGAHVLFTSRSREKIEAVEAEVAPLLRGNRLVGICVDLETETAVDAIIDALNTAALWPTALVNNARNLEHLQVPDDGLPHRQKWLGEYLLDVVVPFDLTMRLSRHAQGRLDSVVNISSLYGVVATNPGLYDHPLRESPIHYGVAKAALIHLTKELAVRLAPKEIRVNAISYGGVEGRATEEFKQRYAKHLPLGRMLRQEEVVGALEFLVGSGSRGMTGHNLVVDGGWSVW